MELESGFTLSTASYRLLLWNTFGRPETFSVPVNISGNNLPEILEIPDYYISSGISIVQVIQQAFRR